jgi:hypothetical protein
MAAELTALLEALREARAAVGDLGDAVAEAERPFKEQIKAATGDLRAALKEAETWEDEANQAARAAYEALDADRRAKLRAGQLVPGIDTPDWCSVRMLDTVRISDPEALPREAMKPDPARLKSLLQGGATVQGAELVKVPSFALRQQKS